MKLLFDLGVLTDAFSAILNMSVNSSAAILIVLLARAVISKAPKLFSYALWAVVLFRLLSPVTISSEFSLLGLVDIPAIELGAQTEQAKWDASQQDDLSVDQTSMGDEQSSRIQPDDGQSGQLQSSLT